ncbi:hypothetical protein [Sphingomonas sp.]|jgi:hypothetical protein|uniref:hypothetical protein n=1 Tax=Sphingomonas sp. TaxID=28214 RepID=UPI002EDA088A
MALPDAALGPITAAVIAALLSLVGLIVAKEHKTSEFRQAWIDAVRDDIGILISSIMAIHSIESVIQEASTDHWKHARQDYVAANQAITRLRLRLNPDEDGPARLRKLFEETELLMNSGFGEHAERLGTIEAEVIEVGAMVLKSEWRRVKAGELTFRMMKWLMVVGVVAAIILATITLI